MRVSTNGGESTVIRSVTNAKLGYDATTRRLYVFDKISTKLYLMELDGSDSSVAFVSAAIERFTVDDLHEKIYYISSGTGFVDSKNFNGSDFATLLGEGNDDLSDIQVDPARQ